MSSNMSNSEDGCQPAADVLGAGIYGCSECPFPFCVITEARIVKTQLREQLARIMKRLGKTANEIAEVMDMSTRSVYRYESTPVDTGCTWCNLFHSEHVVCGSSVYTAVCKNGQYTVVLNKHKRATEQELKVVEGFIEYVFPSSIATMVDDGHSHWLLNTVELGEAKDFQRMCGAFDNYVMSLSGSEVCLQATK